MYDVTRIIAVIATILAAILTVPVAHAEPLVKELETGAWPLNVSVDIAYGEPTVFTVTFIDPVTGEIERHVDYDFEILVDGKEIFRASQHLGRPVGLLHSVSGIEKHAYSFEEHGSYTIRVVLFGFRMVWIEPANADFAISVTPEFSGTAAIMTSSTAIAATLALYLLQKKTMCASRLLS